MSSSSVPLNYKIKSLYKPKCSCTYLMLVYTIEYIHKQLLSRNEMLVLDAL